MLQVATVALIAYHVWRGGVTLGVALMATGLAVHLTLALRLARATMGGVGGHAEWVRDVSTRPRLRRSPAWFVGLALIVAGLALVPWR